MIEIINKKRILWLVVLLFLNVDFSLSQVNDKAWLFKNRIQSGIDYDNNVEESRSNQFSDGLIKLIWESQAKHFNKTYLVNLQYHGGVQYYFQTTSEHKTTHDLSAFFVYQLLKHVRLGSRLWGRFKYFNGHDWHYYLKSSELFLIFNIFQFQSTFAYENEGLNYLNYNRFNFNAHHTYFLLMKRIGQYFSGHLKAGYRSVNYQRYALSHDSQLDDIRFFNYLQKDDNAYVSIQGSYKKGVLSTLEYQYQRNLSNSYGFAYQQHRLTLSLISPLSKNFLVRIFGGIHQKKYDEALNKIIVTELDSEREISNFLIIDCSRDVTSYLSIIIRWSRYNNESPIPGRYYHKSLTSISLEYRF